MPEPNPVPQIHGQVDPAFEKVRAAFAENFEKRLELGASLAILLDGKPVVDIWAGTADRKTGAPWNKDTLANVYSTTKGMTAICAHRLVDQGKLDLDAPVAKYWPQFAQKGKENLPVRYLLGHRAGLPAVRELLPNEALFDWNAMTTALAAEEPWWTPGEKHGYHAVTFGWLVGEVVRRISGKSVGRFFHDEIAGPLGADFHIGTDAEVHGRIARMTQMKPSEAPPEFKMAQPNIVEIMMKNPTGITARAFMNPPTMARMGIVNTPEWRTAEIPAANGHATALSLARIYGALARGGELSGHRVLTAEGIARCHEEQSFGKDEVLQINTRFGLGFMMSQDFDGGRFGPNPRSFGHPGAGGSVGYADPDAKIGFGYVMNRMGMSIIIDPRPVAIMNALYECL